MDETVVDNISTTFIANSLAEAEKIQLAFKNGTQSATIVFRSTIKEKNLNCIKAKDLRSFLSDLGLVKYEANFSRAGELYISVTGVEDALKIISITSISGISCIAKVTEVDIIKKYVLKGVESDIAVQEIAEELNWQNIPWLQIIRFTRDEGKTILPIVLIKELGNTTRANVNILFRRFKTESYWENPKVCRKCLKFGHFASNCRGKEICSKCGLSHKEQVCSVTELKCYRCGENHDAFSKVCPVFLQEKEKLKSKPPHLKRGAPEFTATIPSYAGVCQNPDPPQKKGVTDNTSQKVDQILVILQNLEGKLLESEQARKVEKEHFTKRITALENTVAELQKRITDNIVSNQAITVQIPKASIKNSKPTKQKGLRKSKISPFKRISQPCTSQHASQVKESPFADFRSNLQADTGQQIADTDSIST